MTKPLPRSTTPMKRTPILRPKRPMRAISKKTAAMRRKVSDLRRDYRDRYPVCPWSGAQGVTIHEILSGSTRTPAYKNPAYWLPAGWIFHTTVLQHERRARQWARKKWLNDGYYSEEAVNAIRGKGCDLAEIDRELTFLRNETAKEFYDV